MYSYGVEVTDGGLGCIINVASLLGLKGGRGSAAYAASKAGVIGEFGIVLLRKHTHCNFRRLDKGTCG